MEATVPRLSWGEEVEMAEFEAMLAGQSDRELSRLVRQEYEEETRLRFALEEQQLRVRDEERARGRIAQAAQSVRGRIVLVNRELERRAREANR